MLALIPILATALAIGAQKGSRSPAKNYLVIEPPIAKPGQDPFDRLIELVDWWMADQIIANGMVPDDADSWYEIIPSSRDVEHLQAMTGLRVLGYGAFRIAFALGSSHVVKVSLNSSSNAMTLNEADIWNEAFPSLRRLLVPVMKVNSDGKWIIMKRAEPIPASRRKEILQAEIELLAEIELRESPIFGLLLDLAWFNWGLHNGKIKLLDYGA